jgi:hypothetical protein
MRFAGGPSHTRDSNALDQNTSYARKLASCLVWLQLARRPFGGRDRRKSQMPTLHSGGMPSASALLGMVIRGHLKVSCTTLMEILAVVLQGPLAWAVRADDPIAFRLDCFPGWSMLNPALYPGIAELGGSPAGGSTAQATFISQGSFYFLSNGFFLALDEDRSASEWAPETCIDWESRLSALASHLRSESKQASLNPKLKSFGPRNLACLAPLELPEVGEPCCTASWHLRTAIRGEHILRAGREPLKTPPPSYDTLLLNSIDSLLQEDYPTAFLLASISMDHLSRMQAAIAFAASVSNDSKRQLMIDFPSDAVTDQREERKKVLFDLIVNERRFKDFLHRVPLALTGRSLLQDNKDLYDAAIGVYQIRNQVVHKELTFSDDSPRFYGCDEDIRAIRCAVQLVGWFGLAADYAHPFDGVQMTMCYSAKH